MEPAVMVKFVFPKKPGHDLFKTFLEKLHYCSGEIVRFNPDARGNQYVDLEIRSNCYPEKVMEKVGRLYQQLASGFIQIDKEVIWDHQGVIPVNDGPIFDQLIKLGWLIPFKLGCIALSGPALALFHYFDGRIREMAEQFEAVEMAFPSLIAIETLNRINYLSSFPHHLNMVSRLTGDLDQIEAFSQNAQTRPENLLQSCQSSGHVLSPSVCFHCYQALEGRKLKPGELIRVTALGKCFRHELGRLNYKERLWDFTMREIIFIGDAAAVSKAREKCLELTADWFEKLNLNFTIETATDPFFVSDFSSQYFYQLVNRTKYELNVLVPEEDKYIAAGSFNLHQNYFGKAFQIEIRETASSIEAYTGCVGFGLERLVYAFISQYGVDIAQWPAEIKTWLSSKTRSL